MTDPATSLLIRQLNTLVETITRHARTPDGEHIDFAATETYRKEASLIIDGLASEQPTEPPSELHEFVEFLLTTVEYVIEAIYIGGHHHTLPPEPVPYPPPWPGGRFHNDDDYSEAMLADPLLLQFHDIVITLAFVGALLDENDRLFPRPEYEEAGDIYENQIGDPDVRSRIAFLVRTVDLVAADAAGIPQHPRTGT